MTKFFLILFLSLMTSAFAGVFRPEASHFKLTGKVETFEWAPARYASAFRYDVHYYIPDTIKDLENVKTLIFMHGGGSSTLTREGSLSVATSYMKSDMVRLANELQMVVVVPSASGLNWGGHTVGMIRDLNHLMRLELKVDHNNMGLSGHSMGGMGIGRSFDWLADEFAWFLPMAAGIDPALQNEERLNKAFNVPYVHLQGSKDHFKVFIERCQEHLKRTLVLEEKYKAKSKLEIIYYDGSHNYDYNLMKTTMQRLQATPRNIYQKSLYGSLYYNNTFYTENNITFHQGSNHRYFWIEIIQAAGTNPERLDFRATITNNIIQVNFKQTPANIEKLRINLSKKLLVPGKYIELMVNGKLITKKMLEKRPMIDKVDRAIVWDDYIDIKL